MTSFLGRMIGAAKLDVGIYEEVEADSTATVQAMSVVVLSSLATGVGVGSAALGVGVISPPISLTQVAHASFHRRSEDPDAAQRIPRSPRRSHPNASARGAASGFHTASQVGGFARFLTPACTRWRMESDTR